MQRKEEITSAYRKSLTARATAGAAWETANKEETHEEESADVPDLGNYFMVSVIP